jgi:hypothetical protein
MADRGSWKHGLYVQTKMNTKAFSAVPSPKTFDERPGKRTH